MIQDTAQNRENWKGFLLATRRCWLATAKVLADAEINIVDYDMLNTLNNVRGKHMFISELAETVGLTRSGATRAVDRMHSLGFMERSHSRDDRRHTIVKLTDRGVRQLKALQGPLTEALQVTMTSHFTDEELETVLGIIGQQQSRDHPEDTE